MLEGLSAYLTPARDVAAILLCVEIGLLGVIPLYVLLRLTRWLGLTIPWTRSGLRSVDAYVHRVASAIDRAMALLRSPFLFVASVNAQAHAVVTAIRCVLGGGGR